jgi:hypothetical protein
MTSSSTTRAPWDVIQRPTGANSALARSTHSGGAQDKCPKIIPRRLENTVNNSRKGEEMILPMREEINNLLLFKKLPFPILHLVLNLYFIGWIFYSRDDESILYQT